MHLSLRNSFLVWTKHSAEYQNRVLYATTKKCPKCGQFGCFDLVLDKDLWWAECLTCGHKTKKNPDRLNVARQFAKTNREMYLVGMNKLAYARSFTGHRKFFVEVVREERVSEVIEFTSVSEVEAWLEAPALIEGHCCRNCLHWRQQRLLVGGRCMTPKFPYLTSVLKTILFPAKKRAADTCDKWSQVWKEGQL